MKFKKGLAVICLIVFIFCVSGAWAGDAGGNLTANDLNDDAVTVDLDTQVAAFGDGLEDGALSSVENEDVAGNESGEVPQSNPKTFTDLNDAIQNSTGGDIYLNCSYAFDNDSDYSFKDGIRITREGLTIHGNGHTLDGNNLARIFNIQANVVLKDIVFINGNGYDGGAVHGDFNVFSFVNCTFVNNHARLDGGAIFGRCSVEGCSFENNDAVRCGGAIYCNGDSERVYSFSNSSFIKNHAGFSGGAVYCWYKNSFIDCKFIENRADDSGAILIELANCSFENCSFTKNSAATSAILVSGNSSFSGCSFMKHSGGLILSSGNTFIVNSNFDHNYNPNWVRCISFRGVGVKNTIKSCNFTYNVADSQIIYSSNSRGFSTENCIFKNNNGSLMFNPDSVVNCSFTGNRVGLYGLYNASSVEGCSFIGNVGGTQIYQLRSCVNCIFEDNSGTCVRYVNLCKDCNFTGNSDRAVDSAGRVKNCRFVDNTNGALMVSRLCEDCVFINNYADLNGGAVIGKGASIVNCIFTGNSAGCDGGAIYGDFSVEGCSFKNNVAGQEGGAIWGKTSKNVKNCNFTNNHAQYGGAVKNSYCINCIFTKNSAVSFGGALLDAKAKKCTFIRNSANNGGAMYKGSFMDCKFVSNWASCGFDTYDTYSSEYSYKLLCTKKIVTFYRVKKSFVITLKNKDGKPISGIRMILWKPFLYSFDFNTNKKGRDSCVLGGYMVCDRMLDLEMVAKNHHYKSNFKVPIRYIVKKAPTKFTAASKTFNVNDKTKKYVVSLKYNKNRPLKATISLKVAGKTYVAKTNSKGQAVFYLKDLNKKGSFKAALTYAGSSCFNKAYKAAVIRVT